MINQSLTRADHVTKNHSSVDPRPLTVKSLVFQIEQLPHCWPMVGCCSTACGMLQQCVDLVMTVPYST